ncbi:MAG: hypothetical protein KDC53_03220, partial [Saprospiraceae bacterium]|nr:hypothetical protein [Saprospiraceae bacterium]
MQSEIKRFLNLLDKIPFDPHLASYHDGKVEKVIAGQIKPFSNQFFYIFDYWKKEIVYIHPNIFRVLGIKSDRLDYNLLMKRVHPDDITIVIQSSLHAINYVIHNKVENLLENDVMINFRMQKGNGKYIHIMRQIRTIKCDKFGNLLQTAAMISDITKMKNDKSIEFTVSEGLRGIVEQNGLLKSTQLDGLTDRENQILELL